MHNIGQSVCDVRVCVCVCVCVCVYVRAHGLYMCKYYKRGVPMIVS